MLRTDEDPELLVFDPVILFFHWLPLFLVATGPAPSRPGSHLSGPSTVLVTMPAYAPKPTLT